MVESVCKMVVEDIKTILVENGSNYIDIEGVVTKYGLRETPSLMLGCADCSWVKTLFISDGKLYITACECEIWDEDKTMELGVDYTNFESILFILEWLKTYGKKLGFN